MTSIQITERLAFPVEAMWAFIGDFGGIHRWHPQVCRLDLSWQGRVRTVHYTSGVRVVERLEAGNARRMLRNAAGGGRGRVCIIAAALPSRRGRLSPPCGRWRIWREAADAGIYPVNA